MRNLIAIILLSTLLPLAGQAQKIRVNPGSNVKYLTTEYDFGRIPQHVPATTVFEYKAIGIEPVVLTYVKPSCGCTMPEYQKEPLWPGNTGEMKVTYDAKTVGSFTKTIIVQSNAPNNPRQILTIKGEVYPAKKTENQ